MTNYHINKDGKILVCHAKTVETCRAVGPSGEKAEHSKTKKEARIKAEKILMKINGNKIAKTFKMKKNEQFQNIEENIISVVSDPTLKEALNNPEIARLANERDQLKAQWDELNKEKDITFEQANKMVKISDFEGLAKKKLADLKNTNAEMVANAFPEPTEHELQVPDNFEKIATYESGTKEWLQARQGSLGGSDVGALVFADNKYGSSNYYEVRDSNLDLDPQDQEHSGAAGRGDLWEPALVDIASKKLGEPVYVNKSTFREKEKNGEEGYRHVNLDGFTVNEDGSIKAIIECKTSSMPEEWENGKIPEGYILQCQHYMDCLNVDKAYISVNIDDRDYKLVEVTPDTKIKATEAAGRRKDLQLQGEFNYQDVKNYSMDKMKEFRNNKKLLEENGKIKKKPNRRKWKESWSKALNNPAGLAFIDIETSHTSEKRGHVLEVAAFKEDKNGKLVKFHKFYGVPKEHEEWNGTGLSEVHHIYPEDVRGLKPLREDDKARQELKNFLTDDKGRMMTGVAHNATYEKKHFAKSIGISGIEWADTMNAYAGLGDENRKNNSLESLVNDSGKGYIDAHHADADTMMMYRAYKDYLLPKMKKELENN